MNQPSRNNRLEIELSPPSSPEKRSEHAPEQTIQDGFLIEPRAARLADAVADGTELAGTVSVRGNRNHDICLVREARVLGREVETVRAGIDLEATAGLFRALDNALDVELITGPLEQKTTGVKNAGLPARMITLIERFTKL